MKIERASERINETRHGAAPSRGRTVKLTKMGMLVAISVVFSFIHFPILPTAPFLEYELSDIPILVGGFVFGPVAGLVIAVVSILLHDLIAGSSSGPYGTIMHIIAVGVCVLVSAFIYKKKKTKKGACIALCAGGLAMTAVMLPANLVITPLFMGLPISAVREMLLPAILPFNLIKAALNAVIVYIFYKMVSPFLHRW
ncbi:MAG: ECF transporter S component [Clostridiales Family XIII bacterium]|nr:ECF transporter S component [Clostridiales Family XIII bacterium]